MATAESITVNCKDCGHTQEMPASYSGRMVRCASCGERMRAPVAERKLTPMERRDQEAREALASEPITLRPFVVGIAILSVLFTVAFGSWLATAAACIFWAIVTSSWAIVDKLSEIADLLRSHKGP